LSGQTVAAQKPGEIEVFCGAFFQKSDRLHNAINAPGAGRLPQLYACP
jgi:hypothetical protein